MNTTDVIKYGHLTLSRSLKNIPMDKWEETGVCGVWSVKDIVAHLASYELVLIDAAKTLLEEDPDLTNLTLYGSSDYNFNDEEVDKRQSQSPQESLDEYVSNYEKAGAIVAQIPPEKRDEEGTIPWYGKEYSFDDFVVYAFYGHKREHSAQIDAFRDKLEQ